MPQAQSAPPSTAAEDSVRKLQSNKSMDRNPSVDDNGEIVESSNGKEYIRSDENSNMKPYVGMEFESEEAAKDEKDVKIRELTAELPRERKRCGAIQRQLDKVLKDMEEHSKLLSRNIDNIVKSMKEIE